MWKNIVLVTGSIGLNFFGFTAQAQDSLTTAVVKWDLATAIAYAKEHNIQVNLVRLDERLMEQDLSLARAARYPNLLGSLNQSFTRSQNANPAIAGQSNVTGNYSINSAWTIYQGGYMNYDVKSKGLQMQAANLNVAVTQNDISLQITQAYLNILISKENIVYIQGLLKTSQAQHEQGKTRYNAGGISKKELLQLEAQVASDQYNLVTAQSQYRQNILTLKQILQLPTTTEFQPVVARELTPDQVVPSLLEAQRIAYQSRPEVKYGELQTRIAETELQKARAGYKPTIAVGGSLSTGYSDNQGVKYFNQINNNFYQRAGVSLSVPLFENRINKTNVERSKIAIEQSRLSLDQTKTDLNQQIEQAYISVQNAQAQYKAADVQLKANREAYNISEEQLRLGAIDMVDLLVQRNLYMQSLQNFIQAKYNSILNTKIYEFYMGQPITL